MRALLRLSLICVLTGSGIDARERIANWGAKQLACDGYTELRKQGALKLGVRFSISNPDVQTECARALDFWAAVLDMEWHEDNSRGCAIQIGDGAPDLFAPAQVARAQLPNRRRFHGLIAFNASIRLTGTEQFLTAVHELGHVLGLPHNSSASSIMFYLSVDGPLFLDSVDLAALATRHKLRISRLDQPLPVTAQLASQMSQLRDGVRGNTPNRRSYRTGSTGATLSKMGKRARSS